MILGDKDLSLISHPCLCLDIKIHAVAFKDIIVTFEDYISRGKSFIFCLIEKDIIRRQNTAVIGNHNVSAGVVGIGFLVIGNTLCFNGHRPRGYRT